MKWQDKKITQKSTNTIIEHEIIESKVIDHRPYPKKGPQQ